MTPHQGTPAAVPSEQCRQARTCSMAVVDGADRPDANEGVVQVQAPSIEEALPTHVISDIIDKVQDARDLANCMATSKTLHEAVEYVRSVNLVCRKRYYDLERERRPIGPCSFSDEETESDSDEEEEEEDEGGEPSDACCGQPISENFPVHVSFKDACLNMLRHVRKVEQLRIEVDAEMQEIAFRKEELGKVDFWLSEPVFVRKWLSLCGRSLRDLTLVDYGQQAIMRQSPIVRVLSETCKGLQRLELRNMYLDTSELATLPELRRFTLRCVKLTEESLADIDRAMPELETLALVNVCGMQEARLTAQKLEVLCLGLSSAVTTVDLDLKCCTKLQLKMTCPDKLRVCAPRLAYIAVCMAKRDGSVVAFDNVHKLKELLFGASHFRTLAALMRSNPSLEKLFLDVPCLAPADGASWTAVLHHAPRQLPDIPALRDACRALHTLSLGPGLWHSLQLASATAPFREWPALHTLIVHLVVPALDPCVAALQSLLAAVPSLLSLHLFLHLDSPVPLPVFAAACSDRLLGPRLHFAPWKRTLNFSCFSF